MTIEEPPSPRSVVHLDDAGLVRVSPLSSAATIDAPHILERLRPFSNAAGVEIRLVADKNAPPWDQEKIVELVKRAWPQFIILYDDASPFADTLAMMALEEGYDVYVVYHRMTNNTTFSISRLEKAGATLMMFERFPAECCYGAKVQGKTDAD